MEKLKARVRAIGDRETGRVTLFAVYSDSRDNSFWVSGDRIGQILETEPGTAISLDTQNRETGELKSKTLVHSDRGVVFLMEDDVMGYTTLKEFRFIGELLDNTRELREASEDKKAKALAALNKIPSQG